MRLQLSAITASLATAAILAWPTTASALKDLVIDVNCASGDRIARALDRPNVLDRRMVIVVNGTCNENVVIERDDVTLKAGTSGGGVSAADAANPAIHVNGARRILVENLNVVGGSHGVYVTSSGGATVRGSSVRNAALTGVQVEGGSSAVVDASTVENNGNSGVVAVAASTVALYGSTVRGNALYGVVASRAANITVGNIDAAGNVCCGNTIENNALDGVLVADGSTSILNGNTIQMNGTTVGRFGVLVTRASSAVIRGGNVIRQNGSATGGGGVLASAATLGSGPGDTPVNPSTNEITANTFGIQGNTGATLILQGGVRVNASKFSGVVVDHGSRLRTNGSTISDNGAHGIFAARNSSVSLDGAANAASNNAAYGLYCGDAETSYSGNVSGITGNTLGNVSPTCTGF
jgi:parallel beta-helix repeat protein